MSSTALTIIIPILAAIASFISLIGIMNKIKTIRTHFEIMQHIIQTLDKPMSIELRKEYESKLTAAKHRHYFLIAGLIFYCVALSVSLAAILTTVISNPK